MRMLALRTRNIIKEGGGGLAIVADDQCLQQAALKRKSMVSSDFDLNVVKRLINAE